MGLIELRPGPNWERQEFVCGEIKNSIATLLTNGGVISPGGVVFSYKFDELDISALNPEDIKSLADTSIATVPVHRSKFLIEKTGMEIKAQKVFVVAPNTIAKLGYIPGERNSIFATIRGKDIRGNIRDFVITQTGGLECAFRNFANKILLDERISSSFFEKKKYTGEILRELADEYGVGNTQRNKM